MSKMRRQRSIQTSTPEQTSRAVQLVESAASDAIDAMETETPRVYTPVNVSPGVSYHAQLWDFVQGQTGCYVYLPAPNASMAGRSILVCSYDTGTVNVRPLGGTIRKTSTLTITSRAPVMLTCDGVDWW